MSGSTRPQSVSWIARLLRGVWPDGNPLRRKTDKAEAVLIAGVVSAFVIGGPAVALTAGHLAGSAAMRDEHMARYRVHAVLLQASPGVVYTPYGPVDMAALARWKAPDGSWRAGLVKAGVSRRAGTIISIWTDRSGAAGPPPRPGHVMTQETLAALTAALVFGFVLMLAATLTLGSLKRRRLAAWDSAWRVTGPQWTSKP